MKRLVKLFSALFFTSMLMLATAGAQSTNYRTGIGARLGGLTSGLTVKHFTSQSSALEGIASFGYRSMLITGLYEKHNDIVTAPGLKWFYGVGGHVGFWRYGGYYYRAYRNGDYIYYVDEPGSGTAVFGLDFILGLDYKFNNAPLNIGLDMKPFVDIYRNGYGYFDGALSFRFVF